MSRQINKPIQLLKGFKDILPEHQKYWDFFMSKAEPLVIAHGFQKIEVPVLEQINLYVKGTGKHTDIVEKELYSFLDKGGENVTLRPEFTPGICRAYLEHGMFSKPQPIKLFTVGPVFRHDNPQAGRFRQFTQLNLEVLGSDSPVIDAELVIIAYHLLEALGLAVVVHVNSIGDSSCRAEFIARLKQYLASGNRKKNLCEACKMRYIKNPLRLLDCKEASCRELLADAPQIVDFLGEEQRKHFMQVLEYLDDLEIRYNLNVNLVRGLDYYNRTTFEIYLADEDPNVSQGALLGGGRYDGLMEALGGRPTAAAGFAVGIERVISKMRDLKIEVPEINIPQVFVAQLGAEARKECFKLHYQLLLAGIRVTECFCKDGLKIQLERANQLGAKIALILGQKELMDHTIILRDMQSGIQEIVNYDKIINEVKKRIDPNIGEIKSYKIEVNEASFAPPLLNEKIENSHMPSANGAPRKKGRPKKNQEEIEPKNEEMSNFDLDNDDAQKDGLEEESDLLKEETDEIKDKGYEESHDYRSEEDYYN